jgi:hypothetical protein
MTSMASNAQEIDEAVALRLQSQQPLYQPEKRFQFLIAEPVLRWLVVPAEVMRAQLDRLLVAVGMPHVELRSWRWARCSIQHLDMASSSTTTSRS